MSIRFVNGIARRFRKIDIPQYSFRRNIADGFSTCGHTIFDRVDCPQAYRHEAVRILEGRHSWHDVTFPSGLRFSRAACWHGLQWLQRLHPTGW
jgi:hypothetical protein